MGHEPISYHNMLAQAPLNEAGISRYLRSAIKLLVLGSKAKFTPATDERPLLQAEAVFLDHFPRMEGMKALPPAFAFFFCLCFFIVGLGCHMRVCDEKNGFPLMDARKQHEVAQKSLIILYLSAKRFPWKGSQEDRKGTPNCARPSDSIG